jgi:cephalosporin hydroxylase
MADNKHYQASQDGIDNTSPANIWNSSFCGAPMIQAWQDLMLWERFLHQYNPRFILELGTFNGGLSTYLAVQSWSLQAGFMTVDWQDWADHDHPLWRQMGLDSCFWHVDMWKPDFAHRLQDLLSEPANHPFLLVCDGGNKPKEMQTFGPMLKSDDLITTHDWLNEIAEPDIKGLPFKMVLQPECEALKSLTRFFMRL